nr:type III-B CRISPR module RAMP protein Cmr1 [Kosmotoga olearia]
MKTPIWTGDIDTKSDTIQPTGVTGSLRWWMETLIRGMNEFACDPTDEIRCPNNNEGNYCPVCLIFGARGRRRLFRLEINGGKKISFPGNKAINIKPSGRSHGWFLGPGIVGKLEIKIISLDEKFDETLILVPLLIASKWGEIGAKTQLGYGVVELTNPSDVDFHDFRGALEKLFSKDAKRQKSNSLGFPNLKEMFFAKVQFRARGDWWKKINGVEKSKKAVEECLRNNFFPIAPVIKNWLRYGNGKEIWKIGGQNTKGLENWLFGTSKSVCPQCYNGVTPKNGDGDKIFKCANCKREFKKEEIIERSASKINISCAYKINSDLWEFRLWGWIPENDTPQGFNRNAFLDALKNELNMNNLAEILGERAQNHQLVVWREFQTKRDTVKLYTDIEEFIQSLLKGEGENVS